MEAQDRSRSPSRRPSRVEQVVGRWLRRSRDLGSRSHSAGRDRSTSEEKTSQPSVPEPRSYAFRFSVQLQRDPGFCSHGLTLSSHTPIVVQDITPGGPADGRLVPGDRLVKINNVCADDLTPAQAAEIIRECHDTLTMTVLRTMMGPKSSFITPEKKAKLKCNPVKVRFAEEVEVNGQSQGNSLLFLPNVLKVYLETDRPRPSNLSQDIVMTLKEKLSLIRIEHFSLVLEQQPGVTKLLHLHEDERIQQIVQKKEPHDYRCLFRACFVPREPQLLLEEDSSAFEYLFLQSPAPPSRVHRKYVCSLFYYDSPNPLVCPPALFVSLLFLSWRPPCSGSSPPLSQSVPSASFSREPVHSAAIKMTSKPEVLDSEFNLELSCFNWLRFNCLCNMENFSCFKGFLTNRESTVNLLVGARYGVSQVVNRKLSIMTALTDFNSITRVELVPESDRVSLVKIYVQDIKPITLLLETAAAKDMSCLIAGYCRVFIDPNVNVFPWTEDMKHKISAEEGYVSRCPSDSDSSTDIDIINTVTSPRSRSSSSESHGIRRKERVKRRKREAKEKSEKPQEELKDGVTEAISRGSADEHQSEASDSCHVLTSLSCDSLDALEEDDLLTCSSLNLSHNNPLQIHHYTPTQTEPHLLGPPPAHSHPLLHPNTEDIVSGSLEMVQTPKFSLHPCLRQLDTFCRLVPACDFLPSPPEASEEDEDVEEELRKRREKLKWESGSKEKSTPASTSSQTSNAEYVFNFDQNDARCYYNLVSNITPDSARSSSQRGSERGSEGILHWVLLSPRSRSCCRLRSGLRAGGERLSQLRKRSRKRRSYLETDYTSTVSFPEQTERGSKKQHRKNISMGYFDSQMLSGEPEPTEQTQNPSPTVSSLTHSEGEPSQLESKPILSKTAPWNRNLWSQNQSQIGEAPSPSITVVRCRVEPDGKESADRTGDDNGPFDSHMFLPEISKSIVEKMNENAKLTNGPIRESVMTIQQKSYIEEYILQGIICNSKLFCPPPAPPSSPFITVLNATQSVEIENGHKESITANDTSAVEKLEVVQSNSGISQLEGSANEDEALAVACSTRTASEEDEEGTISLNSNLSEPKQEWVVATRKSFIVDTVESQIGNTTTKRLYSLSSDFSCALYSISPKLGGASNDLSPNIDSKVTCKNTIEAPNDLTLALTKDFVSPTWSPTIMGRLSASTLRGKIQSLPFYLSRSLETVNQAGLGSPTQDPAEEITEEDQAFKLYRPIIIMHANQPEDQDNSTLVQNLPPPVVEPPTSIVNHFHPQQKSFADTPGPVTTAPVSKNRFTQPGEDVPGIKTSLSPVAPVVVTTQSLSEDGDRRKELDCGALQSKSNISEGPLAVSEDLSQSKVSVDVVSLKSDSGCPSVSGCGAVVDGLDVCGCSSVYTNCFNDGDTFDEELTVYEFSCRTQSSGPPLNALGLPLITTAPVSLLSPPSFPRSVLSSSASELSPLLSPLSDDSVPRPPSGFQLLKADVDQLLGVLESSHTNHSSESQRGQHPRDTCPAHFTENKRVLQIEARRLMSGCHRVVGIEQSPEEMFFSLVECSHILVGLSSLVLWFSSCERCERRNAEAVSGLVDVTRSFRDFCAAAERASSKRSCQDLSIKLLAKQCTALNASVFCLTQLFRTLTAL
ncbi:hypothetical protein WMY93_006076 [Mugilogobius chulae]|uniref:PDZ domain-containing protein n=1 Tax=Mugilogobius chulae TaxID=88201 RepID=A0AAW0PV16_9GOBI